MITITHEEVIARPGADVFAFIADPTNDPHWCPPVLAAEQIEGNGPEEGARYRQTVKPGPKALTSTMEITEYQPNWRMAWEGSNEMLAFHGRYKRVSSYPHSFSNNDFIVFEERNLLRRFSSSMVVARSRTMAAARATAS